MDQDDEHESYDGGDERRREEEGDGAQRDHPVHLRVQTRGA